MLLVSPLMLLALALLIHTAGRVVAFCSPFKVDSFVYSVAAYKLYDADVTIEDLIGDKPPGQALMTGWIYRVLPGPPTRLAMVPLESAFMLAGFAVFWRLAIILFGRWPAAALTFFVVLAHNTYNALDLATDGFNLGENYLLLPMMLAVYAHCAAGTDRRRGLGRGLGVGLAFSIKQTAAGLLLAFVLYDLCNALVRRNPRRSLTLAVWTIVGILASLGPTAGFLLWRGWLVVHVGHMLSYSGGHMAWMPIEWPSWFNLVPLLPMASWILLGLAGGPGAAGRADGASKERRLDSIGIFVGLWLAIELVILWAMTKPCLHYYQQIVVPVAMLAGLAITRFRRSLTERAAIRVRIWWWIGVISAVLGLRVAMLLLAEPVRRARGFDYQAEVVQFDHWLKTWSPGEAAIYAPKKERR